MTWNMRRLSLAIESAAVILAGAALVIHGYWYVALAAMVLSILDNVGFWADWKANGGPMK